MILSCNSLKGSALQSLLKFLSMGFLQEFLPWHYSRSLIPTVFTEVFKLKLLQELLCFPIFPLPKVLKNSLLRNLPGVPAIGYSWYSSCIFPRYFYRSSSAEICSRPPSLRFPGIPREVPFPGFLRCKPPISFLLRFFKDLLFWDSSKNASAVLQEFFAWGSFGKIHTGVLPEFHLLGILWKYFHLDSFRFSCSSNFFRSFFLGFILKVHSLRFVQQFLGWNFCSRSFAEMHLGVHLVGFLQKSVTSNYFRILFAEIPLEASLPSILLKTKHFLQYQSKY